MCRIGTEVGDRHAALCEVRIRMCGVGLVWMEYLYKFQYLCIVYRLSKK
jgi:hypothetical protein